MRSVLPILPLACSIVTVFTAQPQAQGAIFIENFQSQTPGAPPTGATVTAPVGKAIVVSDTTTVQDPFGIPGNRSLMVEKTTATGAATPRVSWTIPELTVGTFNFDVYTYYNTGAGFGKPLFNFFSYQDTTAVIGVRFWADTSGNLIMGDGATTRTVSGAWAHNTVNHVSVEIFADNTYSLFLNDELIGWNSGTDIKTRFAYNYSGSGGVTTNTFQFSIADSGRDGARFFVDNITVIPEPTTMGLLGAGLIAGLIARRKRSIVS